MTDKENNLVHVEEGKIVFYMIVGFDGFYMILSPDDKDLTFEEDVDLLD